MTKVCRHYFVKGRVQGVWYRNETQQKARALNLTGWAKNLTDGRVEIVACGETAELDTFEEWLWEGPEQAEVHDIQVEEIDFINLQDFSIR